MNIKLTCKLYNNDAFYFVKPIIDINKVENIYVYRDNAGLGNSKIKYIISKLNRTFFRFIWRFFQMLFSSKKFDLIIGIYEMPHGLLALIIGLLKNKPVIISVIGNPRLDIRNKGIRGKITNIILKKCDVITVTGTIGRNYYIQEKKFNSKKVFVLPNSIDTEEFKATNIKKKYDIITLGRLSPEKGLDFLIDIVAKIKLNFPNIKVAIAGDGAIKDELQSQIETLSLSENIDLLGYVKDSIEFLNSGNIFLTTSKTEGLPRAVIQSLSCGTPVIASNVGDMSDLVINNKTGYLINNYNDIDAFVKAIEELLVNDKVRAKLAVNSMIYVKENYSHKSATHLWNEIFNYLNIN